MNNWVFGLKISQVKKASKEIVKKHEKIEIKPNAKLFFAMLLIVWIMAPGPPGCCPLSPANYSAG